MTKDKKNGTSTPVKVKSGGKTFIKDIDLKDCPLTLERVDMADISKCTNFLKQNGDSIGIYYLIYLNLLIYINLMCKSNHFKSHRKLSVILIENILFKIWKVEAIL